jgi:uncharacterized membrane protein
MRAAASQFAIALASFVVLDGLWLGVLMGGFYREGLSGLARMEAGKLAPLWTVAAPVYVLLAAGTVWFPVARATSPASALVWGAGFGLVVYGVYDLTNMATLRGWPPLLTVVDILWGATACAAAAWITVTASRWLR